MEEVKKELRRTQSLVDYPRIFWSTITPSNVDYLNLLFSEKFVNMQNEAGEYVDLYIPRYIFIDLFKHSSIYFLYSSRYLPIYQLIYWKCCEVFLTDFWSAYLKSCLPIHIHIYPVVFLTDFLSAN